MVSINRVAREHPDLRRTAGSSPSPRRLTATSGSSSPTQVRHQRLLHRETRKACPPQLPARRRRGPRPRRRRRGPSGSGRGGHRAPRRRPTPRARARPPQPPRDARSAARRAGGGTMNAARAAAAFGQRSAGRFSSSRRMKRASQRGQSGRRARGFGNGGSQVSVRHREAALALVGRRSGQRVEERGAEAVEVGRRAQRLAPELLRAHVGGRADRLLGAGDIDRAFERPGQTEVGQADATVGLDEDVGGLEVAVDHAALVQMGEDVEKLRREVGHLRDRQRTFGHPVGDGLPVDPLHGDGGRTVALDELEDSHDAGVGELAADPHLAAHPLAPGVVEAAVEDLERHPLVELGVAGEPDLGLAAAAERPLEPPARREPIGHGGGVAAAPGDRVRAASMDLWWSSTVRYRHCRIRVPQAGSPCTTLEKRAPGWEPTEGGVCEGVGGSALSPMLMSLAQQVRTRVGRGFKASRSGSRTRTHSPPVPGPTLWHFLDPLAPPLWGRHPACLMQPGWLGWASACLMQRGWLWDRQPARLRYNVGHGNKRGHPEAGSEAEGEAGTHGLSRGRRSRVVLLSTY